MTIRDEVTTLPVATKVETQVEDQYNVQGYNQREVETQVEDQHNVQGYNPERVVETQVEDQHNVQGYNPERVIETQVEDRNVQTGVPVVQRPHTQRDRAEWGTARFVGAVTWSSCTLLSIAGVFLFFFPIGLFAFFCPCDQKSVYRVDGKYYDENDNYLGDGNKVVGIRRLSFRPTGSQH
jgi:hypothetical protein